MLHADLIARARLHLRVVPVEVVDLELDIFHLRVRRQDAVEQLRAVMIGKTDVARLALCLFLLQEIKRADALHIFNVRARDAVQPVIVKILHAAARKLLVKEGLHLLRLELGKIRELVGERERLARIALDNKLAQDLLALSLVIKICGIKIRIPGGKIGVKHLLCRLHIHSGLFTRTQQRQAHCAETKLFHRYSPLSRFVFTDIPAFIIRLVPNACNRNLQAALRSDFLTSSSARRYGSTAGRL